MSLVILGGLALFAAVMFAFHRPKGSAEAGFEERPLDETVFEVFGPCANQEVEMAEVEGNLRAIATQRQTSEKQAQEASRRMSAARDRANRARTPSRRRLAAASPGRVPGVASRCPACGPRS